MRSSASRASREEVLLEQQVLGRVAGERQLGEQHELGARVARALDRARGSARALPSMSPTVAFDLGERDAQRARSGPAMPRIIAGVQPPRPQPSQRRRTRAARGSAGARRRAAGGARRAPVTPSGPPVAARITACAGGGEHGVERAADVALQRAQRGRRRARAVQQHDVAELERVQQLVVAERVPSRSLRIARRVRRRWSAHDLAGRRGRALASRHVRVVAALEEQQHQHGAAERDDERQQREPDPRRRRRGGLERGGLRSRSRGDATPADGASGRGARLARAAVALARPRVPRPVRVGRAAGGTPGGDRQLVDRVVELRGEPLEVGQRVVVAEQPEVEPCRRRS